MMLDDNLNVAINKYFWFHKKSKAGYVDTIRGKVSHPSLVDTENKGGDTDTNIESNISNGIKELKIDDCNCELSMAEPKDWLSIYCSMESDIQEEAVPGGGDDGIVVGTGVYLVRARLRRLIPNLIPMYGLKIRITYPGVKKQCSKCFGNHKGRCEAAKVSFDKFIEDFEAFNPKIPAGMKDFYNDGHEDDADIYIYNYDYTPE